MASTGQIDSNHSPPPALTVLLDLVSSDVFRQPGNFDAVVLDCDGLFIRLGGKAADPHDDEDGEDEKTKDR